MLRPAACWYEWNRGTWGRMPVCPTYCSLRAALFGTFSCMQFVLCCVGSALRNAAPTTMQCTNQTTTVKNGDQWLIAVTDQLQSRESQPGSICIEEEHLSNGSHRVAWLGTFNTHADTKCGSNNNNTLFQCPACPAAFVRAVSGRGG